MKPKQIISALPSFTLNRDPKEGAYLNVAEFFFDTIQGEGVYTGVPCALLRLQGCTLDCDFCDTKEVLNAGNPYTIQNLLESIETNGLVGKFKNKHYHLVITGGSPLLQQRNLVRFLQSLVQQCGQKPFIELENECVLIPDEDLLNLVDCWNNSPKLSNSGITKQRRYKPEVIRSLQTIQQRKEVYYKFVIEKKEDWDEIVTDFIEPELIQSEQIILMPKGSSRQELHDNQEFVLELAIEHAVRYSTREHIEIWDKKTGV